MVRAGVNLLAATLSLILGGCATTANVRADDSADCPTITSSGPDADEIRRLEERGARANVEGWSIEEARAFFAPEWLSVQPNGTDVSLESVFSTFPNGRSVPWAGRFDLTDLDVRVYCNTAIVIGRAEAYPPGATAADTEPAVRFRYLNVWRKVDGQWLYAAQQYTRY